MEKTQQELFWNLITEMGMPIEQNEVLSNDKYTVYNTLGYAIIFNEFGTIEDFIKLK